MPPIASDRPICTVVVTVDGSPDVLDDLVEHARVGLERFPDYSGFLGGALHLSENGTRMIQYLQWESEATYVACRDDPRWDDLESTRLFAEHIGAGRAQMDVRLYAVIADAGVLG